MNSELKYLLKGKWNYQIRDNSLICKNKKGLIYIFKNKDDMFFQDILAKLNKNGTPNPDLNIEYEQPTVPIPLELFHRILRANEVIFEQIVTLRQAKDGLFCYSDTTKDFRINHYEYKSEKEISIDPQRLCQITRRVRDRERVHAKIKLEDERIILEMEFPWTVMTVMMPTVQK